MYKNFLKSEWWKDLRFRRLKKSRFRCDRCKAKKNLQVHHFSYKNKYSGSRGLAIKDTVVLCSICHREFHNIYGIKKMMKFQTEAFIKQGKEEIREHNSLKMEFNKNMEWIKGIRD